MKRKLLNTLLTTTLTMILFSTSILASGFRIYGAVRGAGLFITNYDVTEFVQLTTLTDQDMMELFNQSDRDYNTYSQKLKEWTLPRYNDALKKLAYIELIKDYATRPSDPSQWKAFRITVRDYFKRSQELENRALKELLSQGKGIKYAREEFAKNLVTQGWPHFEDQSLEDIYLNWFDLAKKRLKLSVALKEVDRFEYVSALGYKKEFYVRPVEIFDFAKKYKALVNDTIHSKVNTPMQLNSFFEENPEAKVLVKDISHVGPSDSPLSEVKLKTPALYQEYIANINEHTKNYFQNDFDDQIRNYINLPEALVSKYNDSQKLNELSTDMQLEFVQSGGDYNKLVLSKLYAVAEKLKNSGLSSEQNNELKSELMNYAKSLSSHVLELIEEDGLEALSNDLRVEDAIAQSLNTVEKNSKEYSSEYRRAQEVMIRWIVKFQFKKAALNCSSAQFFEFYDTTKHEGQSRIEMFLKQKHFDDDLSDFKRNKLFPYYSRTLTINPSGDQIIDTDEALSKILSL